MKKMHKSSASSCCGPSPSSHSKATMSKGDTNHHKLMATGKGLGKMGKSTTRL